MSKLIRIESPEDLEANPELKEIYQEFIRPSLREFRTTDLQFALKMFFGLDYRSVNVYKCRRAFTMPGAFKDYRVFAKSISALRRVQPGEYLFLRSDTRESPSPEVQVTKEFDSTHESDDKRVFRLTPAEVNEIMKHINEVRLG